MAARSNSLLGVGSFAGIVACSGIIAALLLGFMVALVDTPATSTGPAVDSATTWAPILILGVPLAGLAVCLGWLWLRLRVR